MHSSFLFALSCVVISAQWKKEIEDRLESQEWV